MSGERYPGHLIPFRVYVAVMTILHLGYVVITQVRLHRSEYWMARNPITDQDLASIMQLASWSQMVQSSFFFIALAFAIYAFITRNMNAYLMYVQSNVLIFVGLALLNLLIHLLLSLPIGNLMEPIYGPANMTILFLLGVILLKFRRNRQSPI